MRIVHVCPFYTPAIGGVKQVVEELAKRQIKEGHEVHVITSDWDKTKRIPKLNETIEGVKVHRIKHLFRVANFMTFWPGVFTKILKLNPDIVHSHLFAHPHFVLSAFAARINKIPHIHTTHCPWSDAPRSLIGKLGLIFSYNTLSRLSLKITNRLIAITPWEINFMKKFGAKENQITVLPNGMDKIFFKKITKNDFKKKHKIDGKMILFFGRLSFTKSPDKFVEIAKLILKERTDLHFVLLGPDEGLKSKVESMIKDEPKITLLEATRNREEIVKMYQSAEIYVLPSYREGLPLTLFEAMACGLPVVATPVNGIPFEIKEPETGFLVDHEDTETFKKRILELIDNPKLSKQISLANRKKAEEYDWDKISKKTLRIYNSEIQKLK